MSSKSYKLLTRSGRIGRVTEGLLIPVSKNVDIVEPISKFTRSLQGKQGIRNIFNVGLEDWQPDGGCEYDLIWVQWCLGHLTDEQVVRFLTVSKAILKPTSGLIVVKENNTTTNGADHFDETDSSVTRQVVLPGHEHLDGHEAFRNAQV